MKETRIEETIRRHDKGYNCAQAVACTYCDRFGIDERTMFGLTEGLGLGMGCMEGTCGAASAACILAGLSSSTECIEAPNSKASTYQISRKILELFGKENGSVICKELKGVESGTPMRPCAELIRCAAQIVEEELLHD